MRKTTVFLLVLLLSVFVFAGVLVAAEAAKKTEKAEKKEDPWSAVKKHKFKKLHKEGYSNCVFATKAIDKGKEGDYELKNKFTKPEAVYARCYFPGPIGKLEAENFWNEIWIDGKLKSKINFEESPDADWDQTQIWVTEDDYKKQMKALGEGEHTVIIWVMKNVYKGDRAVAGENAAGEIVGEMKEIWIPVSLAKGKFVYVVPED